MLSALREFSGISDLLRYIRKRWRSFYDRNRCTYYPAGLRQPVADPDPRHDAVPKIARDRLLLRQSAQPVLDCAVQTSRSALSRFRCRKTAASAGTPHRSVGASDGSIRDPVPNDFSAIFSEADIQAVFTTGTKAYQLYQKLCFPNTGMAARPLPSTSPANCRLSIEQLVDAYRPILSSLASRPGLIAGEER